MERKDAEGEGCQTNRSRHKGGKITFMHLADAF